MISTIAVAALFLGLLIGSLVLWRLFLRLGLRWTRTERVTIVSFFLATALVVGVNCVMWIAVVRPYAFDAFKAPTSSMAPTLLPRHWEVACSECGNPATASAIEGRDYGDPLWICRHFHVTQSTEHGDRVYGADRFLVAKFLQRQRWDLVVFKFPENPTDIYVKRLIGLPGEEIIIEDGQVFADGELLLPPDSIREIEYISKDGHRTCWGSRARPARLADDEYFVLGDFSSNSRDSRWWESGAPGHHPYAVPSSHMLGVVTHIYWPLNRRRTFR